MLSASQRLCGWLLLLFLSVIVAATVQALLALSLLAFLAQDRGADSVSGVVLLNDQRPGRKASSIQVELQRLDHTIEPMKTTVNSDGEYRFFMVRGGRYVVTARAPGYRTTTTEFEIVSQDRLRGSTRLVLIPEQTVNHVVDKGDVVSQNELKARRGPSNSWSKRNGLSIREN